MLISQPDTGEQGLEIADMLVRSGGVDIIVIDSVAALVPKAEIEGEMGDQLPGLQARLMSQALRKLTGEHQARQHAGHLHQPDPDEDRRDVRQSGDDHRRQRAQVLRLGAARHPPHRRDQAGEEVVGNETRVKVVKNKIAPPFREALFDILYGEGISREGEIVELGVTHNIIEKSGAWYAYNGDKIGQGKDNTRECLREHPDVAARDRGQDPRRSRRSGGHRP